MSPYDTLLAEARGRPFACIVGWPVEHSRSPALHGFWLKQHEHRRPLRPPAGRAQSCGAARSWWRSCRRTPNARGCNLTLPHKIDIMPLLDRIHPLAEHIGAVNTVIKQPDGSLEGRNSDGFGFLDALQQGAPQWRAEAGPGGGAGRRRCGARGRREPGRCRRARTAPGQSHAERGDRSRRRLHAQTTAGRS